MRDAGNARRVPRADATVGPGIVVADAVVAVLPVPTTKGGDVGATECTKRSGAAET